MHIEHGAPTSKLPDVMPRSEETAAHFPDDVTTVARLLAELRRMLENGCALSTALDTVAEADATLKDLLLPRRAEAPGVDGTERLDLVQLLNLALSEFACSMAESNIVVLNRKSARRIVRARRAELIALLEEVVKVAVQCCTASPGPRVIRFRIHKDHRGIPCLIVEHCANPSLPPKTVQCQALGVEVTQDHGRGIILLAFILHR